MTGRWGWKLFARNGNRNVAVSAVARKLLAHLWRFLSGSPPAAVEMDKSYDTKLRKLAVTHGKSLCARLSMPSTLNGCPKRPHNKFS